MTQSASWKLALQVDFDPGRRDDNLALRQGGRGGSAHPFDCRDIAMHEDEFFRRDLFDVIEDRFARGVGAELELIELATQVLGRFVFVERNEVVRLSAPQDSGGRFRIGVADEKDGVFRPIKEPPREDVGEGFLRHHAAGERIHAAWSRGRFVYRLPIQDKRFQRFEQL